MKNKLLVGLVVVVLIGVVGAYFFIGSGTLRGGSGSYLEDGKGYIAEGNLASAVIQLKNAVREDPENGEARWILGQTYTRIGDFQSAEKELRAAVRLGVDEALVVSDFALSYLRQGKFAEILAEVRSGERDTLIEARVLAYRGFAYLGLNQADEAEVAFAKALKLAPNIAITHLGMAVLHRSRQDLAAAEDSIDKALANDPDFVEALNLKGRLRRNANDTDGALAAFDRAIELNAGNLTALLARATINIAGSNIEKARQDIDAVTGRVKNHPIAMYLNALLLAKDNKDREAVTLLLETGDFLKNYPPGLYLMAYLNLKQNQLEQAEANLNALLNLVPGEATGTRLLAGLYLRKNRPQKAIDLLKDIAVDDGTNEELVSLLSSAHLRAGNTDEAARLFEIAAKERPDDPELKTRLALTRLQGGKPEAAVAELNEILKTNPDAARAHILLVLTQLRENNLDAALEAAQNLKKNLKDNPLPDNLLGGIWVRKGDLAAGRKAFTAALALNDKFIPAILNLAQLDLAEQNTEKAKANYLKIIEIDKTNSTAMMGLSRLAFAAEDRETGVSWLKKSMAAQPRSAQPRLRLVEYYLAVRDHSAALVVARDMLQAMPENALAVDAMGRTQMAAKQFASATSSYRRVIKLAPKAPVAHQRLARALIGVNNLAAASESLKTALKLAPSFLPAYLDLIALEVRKENIDAALLIAESLRERFPKRPVADLAVGDVSLRAGKYPEAVAAFERANKTSPNSRTTIRLFQARLANQKPGDAEDGMTDWLEKNAKDNAVRFALASHYLNMGKMELALTEHEVLYEAEPENQIVLNNLAWLYDRKDDKRAVTMAEKAHTKAVRSPTIKDTLGWILLRRGDAERGLDLITEAAKVLSSNVEVQYHYAYALNSIGQKEAAKAVLEQFLTDETPRFQGIEDARALLKSLQ